MSVTQKLKFVLRRMENIVGKEENAGYILARIIMLANRIYIATVLWQKGV